MGHPQMTAFVHGEGQSDALRKAEQIVVELIPVEFSARDDVRFHPHKFAL
jgi:hypothetical protein